MPTISVIVPVYKVEEYLPSCIRSILRQTYRDFELILVDDGSPDRCGEICDEFAKQDERIRVIHQGNGGVSRARNVGIDLARGEWIAFVDSDDLITPKYLEKFALTPGEEADLIIQSSLHLNSKLRRSEFSFDNHLFKNLSDILDERHLSFVVPWCKLFRTDLIERHHIRFPETICYCEDLVFYYHTLAVASAVRTVSSHRYIYRKGKQESLSQMMPDPNMLLSMKEMSLKFLKALYIKEQVPFDHPSDGDIGDLKRILTYPFYFGYSYTQYRHLLDRIRNSEDFKIRHLVSCSISSRILCFFVLHAPYIIQWGVFRAISSYLKRNR